MFRSASLRASLNFAVFWAAGSLWGILWVAGVLGRDYTEYPTFMTVSIVAFWAGLLLAVLLMPPVVFLSKRKGWIRHSAWLGYLPVLCVGFYTQRLPYDAVFSQESDVPVEELAVESDPFSREPLPLLDEPEFWVPYDGEFADSLPFDCRINRTPLVLGLIMPEISSAEESQDERLYPSYAEAVHSCAGAEWRPLPSQQMLHYWNKSFHEDMLSALEEHLQLHSPALDGGKQAFLERFLDVLKGTGTGAGAAYVAAGLGLSGSELPALPGQTDELRRAYESVFLQKEERSKPVSFYDSTGHPARNLPPRSFLSGRSGRKGSGRSVRGAGRGSVFTGGV